jgi:mono/diheme cytochrome c family protein
MGLMAEVGLVEREYYCEDCHCMWAKAGAKPRPARTHLAPDYFLEGLQHEPTPAEEHLRKPGGGAAQENQRSISQRRLKFKNFRSWRAAKGIILFLANCAGVCAAQIHAQSTSPQTPSVDAAKPTYLRDVLPILMGKCARCHNDQNQVMQNWLDYHTASAKRWEMKRRVWDSWKGSYFKQPMPTDNSPEHQAITDEERTIIRDWVESGAARGVRPIFKGAQSKTERMEQGKHLFAIICSACHQPTGQGIPGRFPPLAGSDLLNSDKHRAIKIVVNGLQGEVTVNGQKFNNTMPKFPLSDEEIASALTYVYSSFGNSGKDVTPLEVSSVRSEQNDLNVGAKPTEEKSPYE